MSEFARLRAFVLWFISEPKTRAWCAGTLEREVRRQRHRPSDLVWSGDDIFVRGTWRPPSFVEKLLSGTRGQGDRDERLDLVHEHQKVIKRQSKEIKNLNALNDLNASLATNYENLLCKFKLLSNEHEDLKLKLESIKDTNDSLEMKQTIRCAIPISRIDASTSCIDLIDDSCSNPCNEKCYENIVVESCDDLIAKENDELKKWKGS